MESFYTIHNWTHSVQYNLESLEEQYNYLIYHDLCVRGAKGRDWNILIRYPVRKYTEHCINTVQHESNNVIGLQL